MRLKTKIFKLLQNNWTLALLLLCFALWTKHDFLKYGHGFFDNELGFVEILSVLVIINLIYLNIKFRNVLIKLSAKIFLNIKTIAFIFLLYEEASFITKGKLGFLTKLNRQNELNLHNVNFLSEYLIKDLSIPMTDISISINYYYAISLCFFLFIGIGSYIPLLSKFRILFLERKYSFFCLAYPINIIFTRLFEPSAFYIHGELFELFFYLIFTLDTLSKVKLIRDS